MGSVVILDFATKELFDAYLAQEPYMVNKVWEDVTVNNINVVFLNDEIVTK